MGSVHKKKESIILKAYKKYHQAIFKHINFRVFNREIAKDLTQDTFTKTWDYLQKGSEIDNMQAFLYKTATNLIIDHTRKRKEQSLDTMLESGFQSMDTSNLQDTVHYTIEAKKILKAIESLEPQFKEVFKMRYIQGMKPREIAAILNESTNIVSVRITRSKRQIKKILSSL